MTAKTQASRTNSAGFTLTELLMAMLVMTVGLLGLLQSVTVAYQHSMKDSLRKEAVLLAEERMHDLCRKAFKDIDCTESVPEQGEKMVGGAPWKFTVTSKGEVAGPATKKLQVQVSWVVQGQTARHEIFALRTRRDGE